MFILVFSGLDPDGTEQISSIGSIVLVDCLEAVTDLIKLGWTLNWVHLLDGPHNQSLLPIEAFDGCSFIEPLNELEYQWTQQLSKNLF